MLQGYKPSPQWESELPDKRWTPLAIAKYHGRPQNVLDLLAPGAQDVEDSREGVRTTPTKQKLTHWNSLCDYCWKVSIFTRILPSRIKSR